jgi:multidrug efflux pump subunit AcrA (membrane-fusion protein)
MQEAKAAQAMATAAEPQRRALEEAQARTAALASELDGATKQKQAAEANALELQKSLQQERDRTEAMARDLATVRRPMDGRVTVGGSADSYVTQLTQKVKTAAIEPPKAAEAPGSAEAAKLIDRAAGSRSNWIISETTSPVNYTPMATATASSRDGPDGSSMRLAIDCRGGRTELVVSGPAVSRGGADYTISYRVNDGQPVQLAAASPSFGNGAAFTGDVVRLLQSLPEDGHIAIRITVRSGDAQDGFFLLRGLKSAREKLAPACKWPQSIAGPHN